MHENPPREAIHDLLAGAKTIAVVGASSNPTRPSHGIMERLIAEGYRVLPVNPNEKEILGVACVPSLDERAGQEIDIVDVGRRAEDTPPIADAAVRIGAKALWLQSGIVNEDTAARAQKGGVTVVMDACISVELSLLGVTRRRA